MADAAGGWRLAAGRWRLAAGGDGARKSPGRKAGAWEAKRRSCLFF